jgi:oligopeptide transport system substrate-binding protein
MLRKIAIALSLVVILAGVAFAGAKNTLVFSQEAEIPALDPQKSNSSPSFVVGNAVFENLIRTVDGKATPGMAESWTVSEDGKTLTFKLRDAKWSDGKPVTAHDFEYAIKRLVDPATAAEYAFAAYYIKGAKDYNLGKNKDRNSVAVKAKDDKTLVITLNNPTPYFVGFLAYNCFAPARKDIVEKYGDKYATTADTVVYNGPFILKSWKHEQEKKFVKNPKYWNKDAVKIDGAEIIQIADTNTALSMFESGELDFVDLPPNLFKQYEKAGKAKVFYNGATDWMKVNIAPNPKKPWLANKNFRKAMALAIDREDYCNLSTKGLYVPSERFVLPFVMGVKEKYGKEYPLKYYSKKADLPEAKKYLAKALEELKIKDPSKITVEYLIQDMEECRLMAEVLQQQLESALGIKFKIRLVTRKQRTQLERKHDYDMVYHGWMPDYDDPMTYMEVWLSDSSQNNGGYNSPQYDKLVLDAQKEKDPRKRMDMIFKAEKILLEDVPLIPLQVRRKAWLASPEMHGLSRALVGAEYDFVRVYFDKKK